MPNGKFGKKFGSMYDDLTKEQGMSPAKAAAITNAAKRRLALKHRGHKKPLKKKGKFIPAKKGNLPPWLQKKG